MNSAAAHLDHIDAKTATILRLETRSKELQRRALESEMAEAYAGGDAGLVRAVRAEIGRCDRALMELGAGRLPVVPHEDEQDAEDDRLDRAHDAAAFVGMGL